MAMGMLAAVAVVFALAPAATADTTCQEIDANTSVCASTVGDPTTGSFGAGVSAGSLNVCVVVFAACP